VIALLSDSLIRWYADEVGHRSAWVREQAGAGESLTALGDSPRFYAQLAALFEQYCHCFVGADEMPVDALSTFLDDVLRQMERS
jgi:hypothetical protein